MTRDLTPAVEAPTPSIRPDEVEAARGYRDASRAASTRIAYEADWRRFETWCREREAVSMPAPPPLVAVYLSALAESGSKPPTVARASAAIAHVHRRAGKVPPHKTEDGGIIAEVMAGIRRSRQDAPDRKAPADGDVVLRVLWSITGDGMVAHRDRAIIAFGMALAARRSELVALTVADLAFEDKGVRVTIRKSKTDQEGDGAVVAVPDGRRLKPVSLLKAWLDASEIAEGPIFRPIWRSGKIRDQALTGHAIAVIVKARVLAAGLDPEKFAGHSLRAGFVTAAAMSGADVWKIQQVSRHKSVQVLSGYVRDARLFEDHAGDGFL